MGAGSLTPDGCWRSVQVVVVLSWSHWLHLPLWFVLIASQTLAQIQEDVDSSPNVLLDLVSQESTAFYFYYIVVFTKRGRDFAVFLTFFTGGCSIVSHISMNCCGEASELHI